MIGKFVTKLIQSLPTWEVTKYYGSVCIYQLKCLKYKVQTSDAWFNFKCKFMPGSLHNELECEETNKNKDKVKQQRVEQKLPFDAQLYKKQNQLQYTKNKENAFADIFSNDSQHTLMPKKTQKHNSEKYEEKENYSMKDNYTMKKQRKVKRAQ